MTVAPIRAHLLLAEGVEQAAVEDAIAKSGSVTLTGVIDGNQSGWRLPAPGRLDVLLVACGNTSDEAVRLVASAVEQRPQVPVVVCQVQSVELNGFMERVFDAGADDLVALSDPSEKLVEALRKAIARRHGPGAEPALGTLIAIVGPKGGTGKTVVSCNLMAALAETGAPTVVVDLDLQFGDVALGLRLMPERTIHDLARTGGSVDAEKIDGFLTKHEKSGAHALLAPIRPDHGTAISADLLARVFGVLRETHDFVIVDTPAGFTPEVITAIDNSSDLCIVGMLDAFSLKDTKLGLDTLKLMGYPDSKIRVVLNRADTRVGISHEDAFAILGRTPDILVPSDRDITRSINEGVPIVLAQKRSGAARAFRELAKLYVSDRIPAESNGGGRSGMRRLIGKA
jgi:pilus assembly protein CpaE